jgi:tetratricopeptide (TPR) repeat protein
VADAARIDELRRRVEQDPASIAFAQLAEEYRRAGEHEEAVRVSRAGLATHPTYLSARVTLGRALLELRQFDEARAELEHVLRAAPDNLAAIRALAEIHQRRGDLGAALDQFSTAHAIARDGAPPDVLPPPDYARAFEAIDSLTLQLTGPPPPDPVLEELEAWLDAILADRVLRPPAPGLRRDHADAQSAEGGLSDDARA